MDLSTYVQGNDKFGVGKQSISIGKNPDGSQVVRSVSFYTGRYNGYRTFLTLEGYFNETPAGQDSVNPDYTFDVSRLDMSKVTNVVLQFKDGEGHLQATMDGFDLKGDTKMLGQLKQGQVNSADTLIGSGKFSDITFIKLKQDISRFYDAGPLQLGYGQGGTTYRYNSNFGLDRTQYSDWISQTGNRTIQLEALDPANPTKKSVTLHYDVNDKRENRKSMKGFSLTVEGTTLWDEYTGPALDFGIVKLLQVPAVRMYFDIPTGLAKRSYQIDGDKLIPYQDAYTAFEGYGNYWVMSKNVPSAERSVGAWDQLVNLLISPVGWVNEHTNFNGEQISVAENAGRVIPLPATMPQRDAKYFVFNNLRYEIRDKYSPVEWKDYDSETADDKSLISWLPRDIAIFVEYFKIQGEYMATNSGITFVYRSISEIAHDIINFPADVAQGKPFAATTSGVSGLFIAVVGVGLLAVTLLLPIALTVFATIISYFALRHLGKKNVGPQPKVHAKDAKDIFDGTETEDYIAGEEYKNIILRLNSLHRHEAIMWELIQYLAGFYKIDYRVLAAYLLKDKEARAFVRDVYQALEDGEANAAWLQANTAEEIEEALRAERARNAKAIDFIHLRFLIDTYYETYAEVRANEGIVEEVAIDHPARDGVMNALRELLNNSTPELNVAPVLYNAQVVNYLEQYFVNPIGYIIFALMADGNGKWTKENKGDRMAVITALLEEHKEWVKAYYILSDRDVKRVLEYCRKESANKEYVDPVLKFSLNRYMVPQHAGGNKVGIHKNLWKATAIPARGNGKPQEPAEVNNRFVEEVSQPIREWLKIKNESKDNAIIKSELIGKFAQNKEWDKRLGIAALGITAVVLVFLGFGIVTAGMLAVGAGVFVWFVSLITRAWLKQLTSGFIQPIFPVALARYSDNPYYTHGLPFLAFVIIAVVAYFSGFGLFAPIFYGFVIAIFAHLIVKMLPFLEFQIVIWPMFFVKIGLPYVVFHIKSFLGKASPEEYPYRGPLGEERLKVMKNFFYKYFLVLSLYAVVITFLSIAFGLGTIITLGLVLIGVPLVFLNIRMSVRSWWYLMAEAVYSQPVVSLS